MKDVLFLFVHLLTTVARLLGPGGAKAVIAENLLLKQQLLVLTRARRRAPNLSGLDRVLLGFLWLFLSQPRISKVAIALRASTLLAFHKALIARKYRALFTPKSRGKPGPKGPSAELIRLIVEIKRRNPRFGCPRIALIVSKTFAIEIDKDVVRRILATHYRPDLGGGGPSWLTVIDHAKDSLWSMDLFRCESIVLKTYWVLVVMEHYTRRIVGFGVHAGVAMDGVTLCRLFNRIVAGQNLPRHLSTDHDPLFEFHRWQANLRVLDIDEIKTIPYVPISHPFVERLIGTIRREYLDHVLFWNGVDLERKLAEFQRYFNRRRVHSSLGGHTPAEAGGDDAIERAELGNFQWQTHCGGLYHLPVAA